MKKLNSKINIKRVENDFKQNWKSDGYTPREYVEELKNTGGTPAEMDALNRWYKQKVSKKRGMKP